MALKAKRAGGIDLVEINVDVSKVIGRINPHIYGFNLEFLQRLIRPLGLWAEMLENRKFEAEDFNHDGVSEPWFPLVRRGQNVVYRHDLDTCCCDRHSQMIKVAKNDGKAYGIFQSGVSITANKEYNASLYLKHEGRCNTVMVSLCNDDGWVYSSHIINDIDRSWRKQSFTLKPCATDADARFVVSFIGEGRLWIDAASLMPKDNVNGMRRDVLEKAKELKIPIVRWPGGCFADGYHWMNGIGPRDKRPVTYDPAWRKWEPNDFGTDEFIQFCREIDAEPYICANIGSGTPEEAAQWVEYCNGEEDTVGGAKRVANGHPEPYDIKYWGIGNEVYHFFEIGNHTDPTAYGRDFMKFQEAMKKADPDIKFVAVGLGASSSPLLDKAWDKRVLEVAGDYLSGGNLSMHYYIPGTVEPEPTPNQLYDTVVAAPTHLEKLLKNLYSEIEAISPRRDIKIALDEWNVNVRRPEAKLPYEGWTFPYPYPEQENPLRDGLFAASVLNTLQRLCTIVTMANFFALINVDEAGSGGCIRTNDRGQKWGLYLSPIYHIFDLYSNHSGDVSVKVSVESPTFHVVETGNVPALKGVPYLDCSATTSDNGKKLHLMVVNRHPKDDIDTKIKLSASPMPEADAWTVNGPHILSRNNFENPDIVNISHHSISNVSSTFDYKFPAHSVTAMVFTLKTG